MELINEGEEMKTTKPGELARQTREALGLYNQRQAAEMLGITEHRLSWLIANGHIPAPSRKWLGSIRLFYNADDIEKFKSQE